MCTGIQQEMAERKASFFVMTDKGLGAVSVTDREGRLLGLMTDGDVRRGLEKGEDFLLLPVRDVMTNSPMVISQQKLAAEALHIMERRSAGPWDRFFPGPCHNRRFLRHGGRDGSP